MVGPGSTYINLRVYLEQRESRDSEPGTLVGPAVVGIKIPGIW